MDHVGDGADFVDGIKHSDSFGGIRHTNGDAVAFFDADGFEGAGDAVDFFDKFVIGKLAIAIFEGGVARPFAGGLVECVVHAAIKIMDVGRELLDVAVFGALDFHVELAKSVAELIKYHFKHRNILTYLAHW